MRRKRKGRSLRPKPVLWLLLVVAMFFSVWLSPITAVRRVRIESAIPAYGERLTELAKSLQGIPCIRIDPHKIEAEVMQIPEVRGADLARNPFGSALLKVTYRVPVARLMGSPDVLLSDDGVLYPSAVSQPDLPQVQLPKGGPPTLATFSANWEPQRIAKLAVFARNLAGNGVIRIQMGESGVVSLNLGPERVILGSLSDLDKKFAVLQQRMKDYPNELAENEALDLTWPDSPSLVPKKGSR